MRRAPVTFIISPFRIKGFQAISEQFHDYMELILESAVANPFGTPPANIRGNLVNETNPENFAFGYFRLSQGIRFRYTIQ